MSWWPGMSQRQRASIAENRAHQQLHPCGVTEWCWKQSFVPCSLLETRWVPNPMDLVRRCWREEWAGKERSPFFSWVLSCFILDMELQVQPQAWDLSEGERQGLCRELVEPVEWEHLQPHVGQGGDSAVLSGIFMGLEFCDGVGWSYHLHWKVYLNTEEY